MSGDKIKMSYSQSLQRVRLSFKASYCVEVDQPPEQILTRAKGKLQREIDAGKIDIYDLYEDNLRELWQLVRGEMQKPGAKDSVITATLACGAPRINEIQIEPGDKDQVVLYLTFKGEAGFAKNWAFDHVRVNINHLLKQNGIETRPKMAHLFSAWLRAKRGDKIERRPIGHVPDGKDIPEDRGYTVIGSKARGEITVVIVNGDVFRDTKKMQVLVSQCSKAVSKLQAVLKTPMEFMKERLVDRLKSAMNGPEKYGIGLPVSYLVGFPAAKKAAPAAAPAAAVAGAAQPQPGVPAATAEAADQGTPLLKIVIEEDQMSAKIEGFHPSMYENPDYTLDLAWIERSIEAAGIKHGFNDDVKANLTKALETKENIDGHDIAIGDQPIAGKGPYLHESYKDSTIKEDDDDVDLREMQQRSLVTYGELIVEIKYTTPPKDGKDVLGREIPPPEGETLTVSIGEGVEMRGDGKYYALFDGVPEITTESISLSKLLVHEGDVNLRSGNIRFDGPAEIKGAIESGSTVEVSGDLVVHGTIRDATVRVGGNLEAKSGVVTGKRGIIRVRNDMYAEFVENSRVICSGNVMVKKVILNSNIVAGGTIETNRKEGRIAGGRVSGKKYIRTAHLGFPKGAPTCVFAGVDWKAKLAIEIRENRLNAISEINAKERTEMRELARKKSKTKKQAERLKEVQARVQKTRELMDKLQAHLDKAMAGLTFDSDARIYVHETLFANVELEVAGVNVAVTHEVAEVEVSPKRSRGSYIHPLSEEEVNGTGGGGGGGGDDKKAS